MSNRVIIYSICGFVILAVLISVVGGLQIDEVASVSDSSAVSSLEDRIEIEGEALFPSSSGVPQEIHSVSRHSDIILNVSQDLNLPQREGEQEAIKSVVSLNEAQARERAFSSHSAHMDDASLRNYWRLREGEVVRSWAGDLSNGYKRLRPCLEPSESAAPECLSSIVHSSTNIIVFDGDDWIEGFSETGFKQEVVKIRD